MGKFERLLQEISLLKAHPGIKPSQLAQETGASERTVYRDMLALSASHIPVYSEKGYHLLDTAFLPVLNITPEESRFLNFSLACPALRMDSHTKLSKSLLSKIQSSTNSQVGKTKIRTINLSKFPHSRSNHNQIQQFFQILENAMEKEYKIRLLCQGSNRAIIETTVHPYFVVFRNQSWHLLGFCEESKDFKTFNLENLKRITLLGQPFQKDPNFSVEKFFENKWGISGGKLRSIKIRFTGKAAPEILSIQYHSKEEVTKQKDGSVIYSVSVEGIEEIIPWILSFGNDAYVIQPSALKEKVRNILKNLTEAYRKDGSSAQAI